MISFACAQCGMKFQVKDEFAGRSTQRTACKQPMTVPAPVASPATICAPNVIAATVSLAQNPSLESTACLRQITG